MSSDWEEVKKLSAAFQKAQLEDTTQRLTERNCIDIVRKLIDLKKIEVIFTLDGKEIITQQHLMKEMEDELYMHNGRINLVDLVHLLNVDLIHLEARAREICSNRPDVQILQGQLITRDYLDQLAEEVDDKMQLLGQISINELTKSYDLPGDFLEQVIHERLGSLIHGSADPYDPRHLFTQGFLAQNKAKVRGVLSALTRPTQLNQILSHYHFPERIFFSLVDELIQEKWVNGSLIGGRADRNSIYIPAVYAKAQNEWVEIFFRQNGYLEYESMGRVGISDPRGYIQKKYSASEKLTFLQTCCVGEALFNQVEVAVEEALTSGSWLDVTPLLPSVISTQDSQQLIQTILKSFPKMAAHIFCDSLVLSEQLVQTCLGSFDKVIAAKSEESLKKGEIARLFASQQQAAANVKAAKLKAEAASQDKREDRRKKAAGGKTGGGTRGRETKTKAVKSQGGKRRQAREDSDDEEAGGDASTGTPELRFLSEKEVAAHLAALPGLVDSPEELAESLAAYLYRPLCKKYNETALELYRTSILSMASQKKKQFSEVQEKVTSLLHQLYLCDKGLQSLPEELQSGLHKHLLKTLATELAVLLITNASDSEVSTEGALSTPQSQQKYILQLPDKFHEPFLKLSASLQAKTTADFFEAIDSCLDICDFVYKKLDKKKEKNMLQSQRAHLIGQLDSATELALGVHLATVLVYLAQHGLLLHLSGRLVPTVLQHLASQLTAAALAPLLAAQELVTKKTPVTSEEDSIAQQVELLPQLKQFAINYKKMSTGTSAAAE